MEKVMGPITRLLAATGAAFALAAPVLVAPAVVAPALVAPALAQSIDATPRIGIISAYEPEWEDLKAAVADPDEHSHKAVTFVTGTLEGREVVLFLSGVSMVNAAMTAQMALDRFNIEALVFSGIAGGVDPALSIGDIVVAGQWGPYLHMVIARETDGSYSVPPFYGTPFPNYGMMFPEPVDVRPKKPGDPDDKFWFEADAAMLETARKAAGTVKLERCDDDGTCLDKAPRVVVGGNGVSGSAFVDNADFRRYVFDTFKAQVLDMESAAVAQVAFANDVPFIAIRSLSDLAGGGEGANELGTFFNLAAANSAAMVRAFLAASAP